MPRQCGVATYTYDLATAAFPRQIVAVIPPGGPETYPAEVRLKIRRDVSEDYGLVAQALNAAGVDVVSVQFAQGIWGGDDGAYVLELVEALRLPVVTTIHSVVRHPTPGQQQVVQRLARASAATVTLSAAAAARLTHAYGVDRQRLEVVPHGVPNLPLVDPDTVKPKLGVEGRRVILSYGLMRPGKGYEAVIEAMPAVVEADPSALYVILGATHADLLPGEGEADVYRDQLVATVERLGMGNHVQFLDRFVGRVELATWLEAADVFVAPYLDLDLVSSGTLSCAMGAGKAVIATPFAFARERLSRGRGVLLPAASAAGSAAADGAGSPSDLAAAIIRLLGDRKLSDKLGRHAYDDTREAVWSAVGAEYGRIFTRVTRSTKPPVAPVGRFAAAGG